MLTSEQSLNQVSVTQNRSGSCVIRSTLTSSILLLSDVALVYQQFMIYFCVFGRERELERVRVSECERERGRGRELGRSREPEREREHGRGREHGRKRERGRERGRFRA
jgi:hypothetical protein